jgi:hypothetical protein
MTKVRRVDTKTAETQSDFHMKNDDFWKSQFAKHEAISSTAISTTTEVPSTSIREKMLQPFRSAQSAPSFEKPVPLVLSRFPAKTKTQWEQWLLNRKAVLEKK